MGMEYSVSGKSVLEFFGLTEANTSEYLLSRDSMPEQLWAFLCVAMNNPLLKTADFWSNGMNVIIGQKIQTLTKTIPIISFLCSPESAGQKRSVNSLSLEAILVPVLSVLEYARNSYMTIIRRFL